MTWGTNNSDNATCFPCLHNVSHTYAAVLTCVCLLVLCLKGFTAWLWLFNPITEKTDLLANNLLFCNTLITFTSFLIMCGVLLFSRTSRYMWSFLLCLTAFGHPLFHCIICLERYLAVQHPTVFLKYRALRYRASVLAPVWVFVIVLFSVHAAVCGTGRDHITGFLFFQSTVFLAILGINSLCCACILRVLIRPSPGDGGKERGRSGTREKPGGTQGLGHQIKMKAFKMVVLIQVFVTICYLPPLVLIFSPHVWVKGHFCDVYMYNISFILFSSGFACSHYLKKMGKPKRKS